MPMSLRSGVIRCISGVNPKGIFKHNNFIVDFVNSTVKTGGFPYEFNWKGEKNEKIVLVYDGFNFSFDPGMF
jgi:hypothetical protein